MVSPKFTHQNHPKTFDKTLPANTIKHYSSNPNLSLEINHPKPPNYPLTDFNNPNNNPLNKNVDSRNRANSPNFAIYGSQVNTRPSRGELTKSLIISDEEKY
jgi:hypothetical protein